MCPYRETNKETSGIGYVHVYVHEHVHVIQETSDLLRRH
jgi:hypothetical protein